MDQLTTALIELEASHRDSAEARAWLAALYATGQLDNERRTLTTTSLT